MSNSAYIVFLVMPPKGTSPHFSPGSSRTPIRYPTRRLAAVVIPPGGIADVVGDTASRPPEQIEDLQTRHAGGSVVTIGTQVSQADPARGKVVLLIISKANAPAGASRRFDRRGG